MALLLGRREGRDVIAAHTVLAHLGGDGKLEFFFTRPLKKPRTECGCQPVLAMMSSIVTPDCRRSISTTRSCLLCEGTIRPLALAVEVFRALPRDFATAVLRRRGMLAAAWEGLVSCVSLMPRARSPLLVMNRPRGRRSSSHAIQARRGQSVALPRAYACTRFRPRCRARRPWLRLCGKGRSDPSARCAAALKITC
jgi:hypothetical protein